MAAAVLPLLHRGFPLASAAAAPWCPWCVGDPRGQKEGEKGKMFLVQVPGDQTTEEA